MEGASNLTAIAIVVLTALGGGMLMIRFRQPALVGYLLAGVVLGPTGFALVGDHGEIATLAELGVLLLLFVVGMELDVRTLKPAWRLALAAVAMQTAASIVVMLAVSDLLGLPPALSILLGFVVALSSTAVSVRLMEEIGVLRKRVGRVTLAVLIAQDLAFLPMMITVAHMDGSGFGFGAVLQIVLGVALLALLVRMLIERRNLQLPFAHIVVGSRDLSPLTGLVYCFGAGALLGLLGLSAAYGAFLAGLVIGNSAQRRQMLAAVRPIENILVMVFFLSIGLLVDLGFIWDNLGTVLLLLLVVTLFKSALNIAVLRAVGETWPRAFLGGVLISQLGEFAFVLTATGLAVGAIDADGGRLVIAVTVLSLALSPLWLAAARRLELATTGRMQSFTEVIDMAYGDDVARLASIGARMVPLMRRAGSWRPTGSWRVGWRRRVGRRAATPAMVSDSETLDRIGEQVRDAAQSAPTVEILPPLGAAGAADAADAENEDDRDTDITDITDVTGDTHDTDITGNTDDTGPAGSGGGGKDA